MLSRPEVSNLSKLECHSPSPVLPLGQRSGMASNPEWPRSASCWYRKGRLLHPANWRRETALISFRCKVLAKWQLSEGAMTQVTGPNDIENHPLYHQKRRELFFLIILFTWVKVSCQKLSGEVIMLPFLVIVFLSRITLVRHVWIKWTLEGWGMMVGVGSNNLNLEDAKSTALMWPWVPVQGGGPTLEDPGESARLPLKSSFCMLP